MVRFCCVICRYPKKYRVAIYGTQWLIVSIACRGPLMSTERRWSASQRNSPVYTAETRSTCKHITIDPTFQSRLKDTDRQTDRQKCLFDQNK